MQHVRPFDLVHLWLLDVQYSRRFGRISNHSFYSMPNLGQDLTYAIAILDFFDISDVSRGHL